MTSRADLPGLDDGIDARSGAGLKIGVLALQGDVREHLVALDRLGAEASTVRRPGELAAVDALIMPGGESTTMSKLAAIFELVQPLRDRIGGGMPTYGSCAGMILLADRILDAPPDQQTIGGLDVTVRRNAFGRQIDSFEESVHVEGIPGDPFPAVFIRAPWVEQVGAAATVLASVAARSSPGAHSASRTSGPGACSPDGRAAAGRVVVVRPRQLLATSFHPELSADTRMHRYFCQMVRESLGG